MLRLRSSLLLFSFLCLASLPAHADLIGSTVTGVFTEGTASVNLFDPGVATNVIPSGYQNQNGASVLIEPGQFQFGAELGCFISCNLISAVFTGTQLDIHTHAGFSFGLLGFPDTFDFTFTDPVFTGVSEAANTFDTTSLTTAFSANTISIDMNLSALAGQDYDAVFDISASSPSSPVPETSGFFLLIAGLVISGRLLPWGRLSCRTGLKPIRPH